MVNDIINLLIKEAKKSEMYRKHAACILKGNKIVSIAHNYMPNCEFSNKKSIHAERAAIMKLPKKYKIQKCNLKMFVIRISHCNDKLMISKPCNNCVNCINDVPNINSINFSI